MASPEVGEYMVELFTHSTIDEDCEHVTFRDVKTTDTHRSGQPYKVFDLAGVSSVEVKVKVNDTAVIKALVFHFKHCRTSHQGVINIYVNNKPYKMAYKYIIRYNFGWQEFRIGKPFLKQGENRILLQLGEESDGEYWLSDISVYEDRSPSVNLIEQYDYMQAKEDSDSDSGGFRREVGAKIRNFVEELKEIAMEKAVWGAYMIESGKAEQLASDIGKMVLKEGDKIVMKKIPLLGTAVGAGLAVKRCKEGHCLKALGELWSGIFSDVPGPGTAISLVIDGALLASDIVEAIQTAKKNKQEAERQLQQLNNREIEIQAELDMYHAPPELMDFSNQVKVVRGRGSKHRYQRALSDAIEGMPTSHDVSDYPMLFTVSIDNLKEAHDREIKRGSFYRQVFHRCYSWEYRDGDLCLDLHTTADLAYPFGTALRAVNLHLQEAISEAVEDMMLTEPTYIILKMHIRQHSTILILSDITEMTFHIKHITVDNALSSSDIESLERQCVEDVNVMTEAFDMLRTPVKDLDSFQFNYINDNNILGVVAFLAHTYIADTIRSDDYGIIQVHRLERYIGIFLLY